MVAIIQQPPIEIQSVEQGAEIQYFEGTMDQFVQLADTVSYPVEYEDGTILTMSIASDPHERIVANLLGILFQVFRKNKDYKRYGSNRHVYLPAFKCAYAPDVSIVKGEPDIFEYSKGKTANLNPWLVCEVISPSSRKHDFGNKLTRYRETPSVQFILYIEQDKPLVTVFSRVENSERWQSMDYNELTHEFELLDGKTIDLDAIYDGLFE